MREYLQFYIDGKWVDPTEAKTLDVINPATEEVAGKISLGEMNPPNSYTLAFEGQGGAAGFCKA